MLVSSACALVKCFAWELLVDLRVVTCYTAKQMFCLGCFSGFFVMLFHLGCAGRRFKTAPTENLGEHRKF